MLDWFADNGRHDLPWQQHKTDNPNPYIVWLSEVMLQQTQVTTVIPYFQRFISSFPTVQDLANADWEMVAEHWAGLGYYARARNLHKGAKQLVEIINKTGNFPQTVDDWENISGVGRSTAGAIVAMGLHGYGVICDGNVKRVLTRWAGIDGDITKSATNKQLWALAERLTPAGQSGEFAQAMMDMGATLCTRNKPACLLCPLQNDCIAHQQGCETAYPVKAKKQPKPSKYSHVLLLSNPQGQMLWLQRPESGIWGGLWSLPLHFLKKESVQKTQGKKVLATANDDKTYEAEFTVAEQIIDAYLEKHLNKNLNKSLSDITTHKQPFDKDTIKHTLTHFHWYLMPITITLDETQTDELSKQLAKADIVFIWCDDSHAKSLGLPKAMLKVLATL
nr:A/G-specific adenine glycosylase [Psychrobacter sp. I-STPA6b]